MSLIHESSKYPSFTLRKHTSPVTSLSILRVPISNRSSHVLKPFLVSADESGRLLIWNLSTHRTVIDIQAHDKQIMSIAQLGLDKDLSVLDTGFFGMFLTHGRDHVIKFWKIFDESVGFYNELKLVYELPVNALNFSNVGVFNNFLISPNTMNSNTFDIYDIGFIRQSDNIDDNRLKRLYEAIDVYEQTLKDGIELKEFTLQRDESDGDVNRIDKFGIIMKLLWVSENLIFIGYESGHVVCLELDIRSKSFKIKDIGSHHFPNPILSLSYDSSNDIVISTSIRSELVIHDVNSKSKTLIHLENFGKLSSFSNIDDVFILSSWNGYIKFFKFFKKSLTLEYLSSFKKHKGIITGDLNVIGNLQNDSNDFKNKNVTKPSNLLMFKHQEISQDLLKSIPRRDLKIIINDYLSIGYDDGTIMIYTNPKQLF